MLWGERVTRRRVLVGVLAFFAVLDVAFALAVLRGGDGAASAATPLPLHPVAGSFEPDGTSIDECEVQACLEQAFGNVAYERGPKEALRLFDARIADRGDAGCHRIAHTIGAAALVRYEGNVARTFAEGSPSCWSGYYHGVLERSLLGVQSRTPASLAAVARRLCADSGVRVVRWVAYQCLHGLGHGLMITTGYELPLSLDVCGRLQTAWDRQSCKGGVFMENNSSLYGFRSRFLRDDDPLYPCNDVARSDKRRCYELVTTRILQVIGFDWDEVARVCSTVERGWVAACFRSFGRDASAQSGRDPDEILRLCALARPYGRDAECISWAARDLTASDAGTERAGRLCAAVSARVRESCYRSIGALVGMLSPAERSRVAGCRAASPVARYAGWCLEGARRAGG
jgi:hypothetical protein